MSTDAPCLLDQMRDAEGWWSWTCQRCHLRRTTGATYRYKMCGPEPKAAEQEKAK